MDTKQQTMADAVRATVDGLKNMVEALRREPRSMDAIPVEGALLDYAQAGMCIQLAMHHLDESLPTGQKERSEKALALLMIGTAMLSEWMELKGYDTDLGEGFAASVKLAVEASGAQL